MRCFPNFAALWNHLESLKHIYLFLGPTSRDSDLIGTGHDLAWALRFVAVVGLFFKFSR